MNAHAVAEAPVRLDGIGLSFGDRTIFRSLACEFPRGAISVILGGSGTGKSTLLRMIGGLVRPQAGRVEVGGEDVAQLSERELYRVRDRIGMLFQHGALLDSLSVFDNVALPLREHTRLDEPAIAGEVGRRLDAVGLADAGPLLPSQLSGGMRRRAALARAIVTDPEIVLCDEPFSGLDPINVRRIEKLFQTLNERLGITLLITSHHIPSTLRMADRIVFLCDGAAVCGDADALRAHPDPRISGFFASELDANGGPLAEAGR